MAVINRAQATGNNPQIRTICFGGNKYDVMVNKDWQESNSGALGYILDRTHYVYFTGIASKITEIGTPITNGRNTEYPLVSGIGSNQRPKAVDKVFMIRGYHHTHIDGTEDYTYEPVSYAIYLPNSILASHYNCEDNGHVGIEIALPLLNSVDEVKAAEECYSKIRFYPHEGNNYSLRFIPDPSLTGADLANIYFGEAGIKQLDPAYIPVDSDTITLDDHGKLTVAPLESRISSLEQKTYYLAALFGSEAGELEEIIDENTLTVIENPGEKAKLSAKPIIGEESDEASATTIYGAKAYTDQAAEKARVTVEATGETAAYAQVYVVKQNGVQVGSAINIPKDKVIKSGTVVEDTEKGTCIKLILANAENSEILIPVSGLIEYVTGGITTEITVSVDPQTHVATATINDASIDKDKLDARVQESLNKADTAIQKVKFIDKILTKTNFSITKLEAQAALGLKSAAYTDSTAYDAAGAAASALDDAKEYTDAVEAELIGNVSDEAGATTIYGAKAAVKALEDSLSRIAKSGKASDISIEDPGNKITATNVEDALVELKNDIAGGWNVLFGQDRQTIVLDGGTNGANVAIAE